MDMLFDGSVLHLLNKIHNLNMEGKTEKLCQDYMIFQGGGGEGGKGVILPY